MPRTQVDVALYQAALVGYQSQLAAVTEKIQEIQKQLRGSKGSRAVTSIARRPKTKRRPMSPEARRRIVEAQRKRWAAFHRAKEATAVRRQRKPRVAAAAL